MRRLELVIATGDDMDVRRFSVTEADSSPWEIVLVAQCRNDDVALEDVVGHPAAFIVRLGLGFAAAQHRLWTGFCTHIEQQQPEAAGTSTYLLRLAPQLWFLQHRRLHRIFQHKSIPEIVMDVLLTWGQKPKQKLTKEHKQREFVVQYGETDLAFVSRLLEEEGITYFYEFDEAKGCELVLCDQPHLLPPRGGAPIPFVDSPQLQAQKEYVGKVRLGHQVRPGKFTIRDFDFRKQPDFPFFGKATPAPAPEDFYEQYRYLPGASLVEPGKAEGEATPHADDLGVARHELPIATARAQRGLEAARRFKKRVCFETNCVDLTVGSVVKIGQHPHKELKAEPPLLITGFSLEGFHDREWSLRAEAVFAGPDGPHQPDLRTPKPRILGVQSAIVVGPGSEEIFTDELGRVRVLFHWDRDHGRDERASCWLRVSQGWAGAGWGTMMIPRVGQEVLVSFLDGDPDQPIVVGRVYNGKTQVPYRLPDDKTQSVWKSDTSKGSKGYNEITFEDKKGEEFIYVQAQRDYQRLVRNDETERVGKDHHVYVGDTRHAIVGKEDATLVAAKYAVQMIEPPSEDKMKILAQKKPEVTPLPTKIEMIDGEVMATVGDATMLLHGGDATFEAEGTIRIKSHGGDVIFEGGPFIYVNC